MAAYFFALVLLGFSRSFTSDPVNAVDEISLPFNTSAAFLLFHFPLIYCHTHKGPTFGFSFIPPNF